MSQLIYKNGCWGCKRALEIINPRLIYSITQNEDPKQQYVCPKVQQHWKEYQKQENYD